MPQTINTRVHSTITAAANDLVTVNFGGDGMNQITILNRGPGIAWISFDPTVPAAVANVNCFSLGVGQTYLRRNVPRNVSFTLNADTAATLISVDVNPYPN
jgi:hypothetical protein